MSRGIFKIYASDASRLEQIQDRIDETDFGDIAWDEISIKKDKKGSFLNAVCSGDSKLFKRCELKLSKIKFVEEVKFAPGGKQGGGGKAQEVAVEAFCESNIMMNPNTADTLSTLISYSINELKLLSNHLRSATNGNIRGRLSASVNHEPYVGEAVVLEGKVRYQEKDYALSDATVITWFTSRSNGEWTEVGSGIQFTPIAEDAGMSLCAVIQFKGTSEVVDAGTVRVSATTETEVLTIIKKKKNLKLKVQAGSERSRKSEFVIVGKNVLKYTGPKGNISSPLGKDGRVDSIREDPTGAVVSFNEVRHSVKFDSAAECVKFVLVARAYSAIDTLSLILSLPLVNKAENPTVSIVNALIQAGSAVHPYYWNPKPELCMEKPRVSSEDTNELNKVVNMLITNNRLSPTTHSLISGLMFSVTNGSVNLGMPSGDASGHVSDEEPEEDNERQVSSRSLGRNSSVSVSTSSIHAAGQKQNETIAIDIEVAEKRVREAPSGDWSMTLEQFGKNKDMFIKNAPTGISPHRMDIYSKCGLPQDQIQNVIQEIAGTRDKVNLMEYCVIIHILFRIMKEHATMFTQLPDELSYLLYGPPKQSASAPKPAPKPPAKQKSIQENEDREEEEHDDWEVKPSTVSKLRTKFKSLSEDKGSIPVREVADELKKFQLSTTDNRDLMSLVCKKVQGSIYENEFVGIMLIAGLVKTKNLSIPSTIPPSIEAVLSKLKSRSTADSDDEGESKPSKGERGSAKSKGESEMEIDKNSYNQLKREYKQLAEENEQMSLKACVNKWKKDGHSQEILKKVITLVVGKRPTDVSVTQSQYIVGTFILQSVAQGASMPETLPSSMKRLLEE